MGKDLKVVSTTNGNDTSDQMDDEDGGSNGLLDGVLGDGSILGVNNLLGGGLLNGAL